MNQEVALLLAHILIMTMRHETAFSVRTHSSCARSQFRREKFCKSTIFIAGEMQIRVHGSAISLHRSLHVYITGDCPDLHDHDQRSTAWWFLYSSPELCHWLVFPSIIYWSVSAASPFSLHLTLVVSEQFKFSMKKLSLKKTAISCYIYSN